MVVSDPDIHRAARLHLERHVDEAVTKACDMVRNLKARGDNEAVGLSPTGKVPPFHGAHPKLPLAARDPKQPYPTVSVATVGV